MNHNRRIDTGFAFTIGVALAVLTGPSCTLLVSTSELADAHGETDASVDGKEVKDGTAAGDARSDSLEDAGVEFSDSFDRPDSSEIGNGWIEKVPTMFVLEQGAVKQVVASQSEYLGLTVFRPVTENASDVEVRVDFISTNIDAYPRLMARLDPSLAVGSTRAYTAIVLVADQKLRIVRGDGSVETTLATTKLLSDFSLGSRYRLSLRVAGASPVTVGAWLVDRSSGEEIARVSTTDGSDQRIQSAGSMGFAGDNELGLTYDDFAYTRW